MKEKWKEYPKDKNYLVSNFGKVKSLKTHKILTPQKVQKHLQLTLIINKRKKSFKLHRIVCETFIQNFDNGVILFNDGNPLNCRLDNLQFNINKYNFNSEWERIDPHCSYEINRQGQIRNIKSNRILKQKIDKYGYYKVNLNLNNKKTVRNTHRLLMMAFKKDSYFDGAVVNHIDGNKLNNSLDNLEWCTIEENNVHASKNNLSAKGSKHGNSKLKESDIPLIRNEYKINKNYTNIAKKYNVSDNTIRKIIQGKTWSHI